MVDGDSVARLPAGRLLKRVEPTSKAQVRRVHDAAAPGRDAGQRGAALDWPYVEGLRLDEAMHPLTLLASGLYGETLPDAERRAAAARGAVEVRLQEHQVDRADRARREQPPTQLEHRQRAEYGFYSNVNPTVDHPRWTQARERRIGEFVRRPTLMFNGYGRQVASLYSGMDLKKNY